MTPGPVLRATMLLAMTLFASQGCVPTRPEGGRPDPHSYARPGETDDADLGLWCAPTHVNLKAKAKTIGTFGYDEVLVRLKSELDRLIQTRERRTS